VGSGPQFDCGPICDEIHSKAEPFCISYSGPHRPGGGRIIDQMELPVYICISPHSLVAASPDEGVGGRGDNHPDRPSAQEGNLVTPPAGNVHRHSNKTSRQARAVVPTMVGSRVVKPKGRTRLTRLEHLRNAHIRRGFSKKAAIRATGSCRESSNKVYQSRWIIYDDWCSEMKVDLLKPSRRDVGDFLIFLADGRNSSLRTVRGYLSAVNSVLRLPTHKDWAKDDSIRCLLKSFQQEGLLTRRVVLDWDLAAGARAAPKSAF
jgi:hypothetical protein